MRCLLAFGLLALAWAECQPACQSPEVCDNSVAPSKCVADPCRQTQCSQFQVCRVETDAASGAPKGVCYYPPCSSTQLAACQAPRTKCVVTGNGPTCSDPCASAGTSGPVCPQAKPICTASADGQSAQCAGPCDDPQACPSGSTCRSDGTATGKVCVWPDPCASTPNPCAQRTEKKCVSDLSVTPPTYTCQNACDPNPCSGTTSTCAQTTDSPFFACRNVCEPNPCANVSGSTCRVDNSQPNGFSCIPTTTNPCSPNPCTTGTATVCTVDPAQPNGYSCSQPDPCRDFQCPATAPKCTVETSATGATAKCVNPCATTGTTAGPCANSADGPVCKPASASPFYTCSNPCNGFQCTSAAPMCVIVEGQPTCQNPCDRSPCQTGICSPQTASPFYTCRNACEPNPCPSGSTCRADNSQPNGYSCTNPCSPNPCTTSTATVCTVDSAKPNGYSCSQPDPCRDYQCPATAPKCTVETSATGVTAKCVNPCATTGTTAGPCANSADGPVCTPVSASPYYTCTNPCRGFQCTSSAPMCVVVDGQATCQNPCNRSPSPCQTGTCRPTTATPFYACSTPCDPNPCTGTNSVCTVDASSQGGFTCSAPNPCEPSPCREAPNTVCKRDTTNAGYSCVPPPDACASSPCTDATKPMCVKDTSTAGFSCQPRPDPCRENPCRTNADQKYFCVPRQLSGATTATYECLFPCDAHPCASGLLCAYNASGEFLRTCTKPQTDPCATIRCDPSKPRCASSQDTATGTWRYECQNPCLTAAGNPCTTTSNTPAICTPDANSTKGYTCTPVASCDTRPCPSGQICSMSGTNIICTIPDPCAPTASGAPRCPEGNCRRVDATTSLDGQNFMCVNPCEGVTCTVGTCYRTQVNGGWVSNCPPVGCGADCVAPRRCVTEAAATGALSYKCITPDVCSATTCPSGQVCVQSSTGTSCVTPNPCAQCTGNQLCVADANGVKSCRDPCSVCTTLQRCNIDPTTATATCTEDPCLKCQAAGSAGPKCGWDRANNGYVCYEECVDSRCPSGSRCAPSNSVLGKFECTAPPTCAQGAACPAGQFCINGACKVDPCATCNRADGFACTQAATGAWGCFYQPCATLRPCVAPEVCKDADITAAGVRGYVCIKPSNTATPTAIQVSLTVTLNINADVIRNDPNFNTGFAQEVADLANIGKERVTVTGVVPSSTGEGAVVTFTVRPADSATEGIQTSPTDVADRLNEKLEVAAASGTQVGNGQYTNAMATGAGAQQVQTAVYQCSNGQWVDSQSACPAPMAATNQATTLAVGIVVGVVGALTIVGAVIYCKKNKAAGGVTGTEMV